MVRDSQALSDDVTSAITSQFRGRLLARGQAQSMIRREGVLPDGAPSFDAFLDDDLLAYGYSLISTSLRIIDGIEQEGLEDEQTTADERADLAREGLIQASYSIEAATRNAEVDEETPFHRLIAGAASHLGGYAARAYSLVHSGTAAGRLTPMERTLADLLMRSLDSIEDRAQRLRASPNLNDNALLSALVTPPEERDEVPDVESDDPSNGLGPVSLLLTENYISAVSTALFALAHGQPDLMSSADDALRLGERASHEMSAPGPWWVYRLSRRLLDDLGPTSIRANIPRQPPPVGGASANARRQRRWRYLRRTFIAALYARGRSEIDLWPSQLSVANRIFDGNDDLVVALPTSAGKTRIAELSILSCLAQGRRAVYVTPLRALSAQTEQALDRTFSPLGARVSSLYGSMGISDVDEDALRQSQIVVATPEKLDFALRSDPAVLDDVGLVVLDEGHMIGPSEREVRYEAQIQRLVRRSDSRSRRIVCLSAVFPSGDDLDDFVSWVTQENPEGLHREDWRPTQQRFGLVEWRGDHARLSITLGDERPFVPRFLEAVEPNRPRRRPFPADQRELVVATAWKLVEEAQTVLVFCPQRNWVEPYARAIVKLQRQGLIESVLPAGVDISAALATGAEWFGDGHPILECLRMGVAIHHGALPAPFRRQVEHLLHTGAIKVTVASPTLAQGLNLSASVVLFHGVRRSGNLLTGAEIANVVGRAGRAFVDTEGLVLYPIFEPTNSRRRDWLQLTSGDAGKTLRSGLIEVSIALIRRIIQSIGTDELQPVLDYLTGGAEWATPVVAGEAADERQEASQAWQSNLAMLDVVILSTLGEDDADPDLITQLIADALRDSLWERQLQRLETGPSTALQEVIASRTRYIWSSSTAAQRRGWYLAGVGADAGRELAQLSGEVVELLALIDTAISDSDIARALAGMVEVAELIFSLAAFRPEIEVQDWRSVLVHWVSGQPLGQLQEPGGDDPLVIAQFIESDLIYRLVWGLEAARVYEDAQGNPSVATLNGSALAAIETGTLLRPAAILIRAGFHHRVAAISAVIQTGATFDSTVGMREWIAGLDPGITATASWPTPESHEAWTQFTSRARRSRGRRWRLRTHRLENVAWSRPPEEPAWLRVTSDEGVAEFWSPGFDVLGAADIRLNPARQGVLHARSSDDGSLELRYRGPDDLFGDEQ